MTAEISFSGNGYIQQQQQHDINDSSTVMSVTNKPSPTPSLSREEYGVNGKSCPIEMTPMLQVSQNSNYPTATGISSMHSKNSPNTSHRSKESSACQQHFSEHDSSNMLDETLSEAQKPLGCSNKLNSSFPCGHITPTVTCLTNCCCSESVVVGARDGNKMTVIHYKVLTTFIGSCLVGLMCLILSMFVSPHLFFNPQRKYVGKKLIETFTVLEM